MIQLNVDYSLLNRYFGIPMSRILQYPNKNIEEIMELEAQQGNKKAEDYKDILSDPDKIIEIFKLSNVENKFIILQNMSEGDLDKLLPFLTQEQLTKGLQFFTDEKLLDMCKHLPIEELTGMILEKFSMFDVLSLMQDSAMDQFLVEPDVERRYMQRYFEQLNRNELEKIMMKSFGMQFEGKDREEYLEHLEGLDADAYQNFILAIDREQKINLIGNIVEQDQGLLLLFKPDDMVRPMEKLMKEDKIKMMSILDPEFLVPMVQELPLDLTQIVLTQIDPREFSEILARDFSEILSAVVLFTSQAS